MRLAAILAVLFALMPVPSQAGTTGSLTGVVTDDAGKPLSGVRVAVVSRAQVEHTTTDAHGFYVFADLVPGAYGVRFDKPGFTMEHAQTAIVDADTQTALNVRLLKVVVIVDIFDPGGYWYALGFRRTADLYSVRPPYADILQPLGAGADALRFVPGVTVPLLMPARAIR